MLEKVALRMVAGVSGFPEPSQGRRSIVEGLSLIPASFAQRRLWFLGHLHGDDAAYHIPTVVRLSGEVDRPALARALGDVVARHESLRTVIRTIDGAPYQETLAADTVRTPLPVLTTSEAQLEQHVRALVEEPFDLAVDIPLRTTLLQLSARETVLVLVIHHIAADGWSMGLLWRDLATAYEARRAGAVPHQAPLRYQYTDYTLWQRELLGAEDDPDSLVSEQLGYWRSALSGVPRELVLPWDRPPRQLPRARGGAVDVRVPAATHARLAQLCRSRGATLFMALQAAVAVLLARHGAGEDITTGFPTAGRTDDAFDELIGFFVNTLVLRTDVSGDPTFTDVLDRTRQAVLHALGHQDVPFERLVEHLAPVRSTSHHALFPVMVTLQNNARSDITLSGVRATLMTVPPTVARYDLDLQFEERTNPDGSPDGLDGLIVYATDLFDRRTVEALGRRLLALLDVFATDPGTRVADAAVLTADERRVVLEGWNSAGLVVPDRTLPQLFAEQVAARPGAVAVVDGAQTLTYAELDARSDRIAAVLTGHGVGPESLVAVVMPHSALLVTALLAVLKAGGAYVPVDPRSPRERLDATVADVGPAMVLTCRAVDHGPARPGWTVVDEIFDADDVGDLGGVGAAGPPLLPDHPAYVIHTSGSTGRPKGVLTTHRNVANLLAVTRDRFGFTDDDVWSWFHSAAFDFSVWELWGALLQGARVVVVPYEVVRSPRAFLELLVEHRVTVLSQTPSAFWQLARAEADHPAPGLAVRSVVFGGEALTPPDLRSWIDRHGARTPRLVNMYGITETTVHVTHQEMTGEEAGHSPIGRGLPNYRTYVLDQDLAPVPAGVAAELYVAGPGLARGYLNQPGLTAQRFVADPFVPGTRMYRTGDVVRWSRAGTLEFLGRADDQVKIRGFRIEPGEVESAINAYPLIERAVVTTREDGPGDRRLVAYVVSSHGAAVVGQQVRQFVRRRLPEWMVPSAVVVLDALPVTVNGKVDLAALPAPEYAGSTSRPPTSAREEVLCAEFAAVLGLPAVGVDDNFFDLGGHSLLAVRLVERLRARGVTVDVRTLFTEPTPARLAAEAGVDEIDLPSSAIPPDATYLTPDMVPLAGLSRYELRQVVAQVDGGVSNIADVYPLGPLQEGLFFHHQLTARDGHDPYVSVMCLGFSSRGALDAFLDAWQQVIDRHDVLRSAVLWEDIDHPVQVVHRKAALPVVEHTLDADVVEADAPETLMDRATGAMDLRRAPLADAHVARLPGTSRHLLVLRAHHIMEDYVTTGIMLDEVATILRGRARDLPEPGSYRSFVGQATSSRARVDHDEYFTALLGDVTEPTTPFDVAEVWGDGTAVTQVRAPVDPIVALRLKAQAARLGVSAATLVHVVWARVVAATSGRDDVVFGTVLFGRIQGGGGADREVGLYINMLPVRLRTAGTTIVDAVARMQNRLAELMVHEHASLATAQRASGISRPSPLFTALLNYRHGRRDSSATEVPNGRILAGRGTTNYPLLLSVDDFVDDDLLLTVEATAPIDAAAVLSMVQTAMTGVVSALEDDGAAALAGVDVLAPGLRELVVRGWNDTAGVVSSATVAELFAARVAANRDAVAVVSGGESVTFGELAARSDRLASCLVAVGVGPEARVAVVVPRSVEMVVALLGVWKAGGVYVPVDAEYPTRRVAGILADVDPVVTVVSRATAAAVTAAGVGAGRVVVVDEPWGWGSSVGAGGGAGGARLSGQNAAYVIYTSGSTGRPKGVVVSQAAVVNLLGWMQQRYGLTAADRVLQKTPITFDASVWEVFWPLVQGAAVVLARPGGQRDPDHLVEVVCRERVTVAQFVPSALEMFLAAGGVGECTGLRLVFAGGEALSAEHARRVATQLPHAALGNLYGPTETAVQVTAADVTDPDRVSIGRPVVNTRVYVLDATLEPVPPGVTGELYVGGVQLARGYLNRPDLTATRFVADPFTPGQRLYRTGDATRWSEAGELEYLGRTDEQVKIRGFRIEPGEIETVLATCPAVRRAVVTAREDTPGDRRLVAYLLTHTPHPDHTSDHTTIVQTVLAHARTHLPEHMVPTTVVLLDDLPTTTTGKLDRRALPTPPRPTTTTTAAARPATAREEALCAAFAEILTLPAVTTTDNFFDLGGHSLLATRLTNRIRTLLGIDLTVRTVFEHPTPERLAERIGRTRWRDDAGLLLQFRTRGDRDPLFCVHAGRGLSWEYAPLIRHLPDSCPVIGVRPRGFGDDAVDLPTSVPEMAAEYVSEIMENRPTGALQILGWSFGGVVAQEMAVQLRDKGRSVTRLFVLDALPQGRGDRPPAALTAMQNAAERERWKRVYSPQEMADVLRIRRNNERIVGTHETRRFDGDIVFLRANDGPERPGELWQPYTGGDVRVHEIDFPHGELLMDHDAVALVGAVIAEELQGFAN